ncbi:MAG: V-type ATP synthase subunit F [Candidatus Gracilibacteria bacterium]|jgi:V/A-type H+-transporting ATPase subunit F|nr:V-type ATP synthase subunit F [Candidatus Gracilibacteria bacterium]
MADKNTYKLAIVGAKEEILGFQAVGVRAFPVANKEEAINTLFEIKKTRQNPEDDSSNLPLYAVIFVMEDVIKQIDQENLKKLSEGALPAIIPLPGHKGSTGYGEVKIRRIIEKAVGSDIFAD